jgi:hypothetical protein
MVCSNVSSTKLVKQNFDYWIRDFHSGDYEEVYLLDIRACSSVKVTTSRSKISPPFQGRRISQVVNQHGAGSKQMEATRSFEIWVNIHRTTWRSIQEDRTLHNYDCFVRFGKMTLDSCLKLHTTCNPLCPFQFFELSVAGDLVGTACLCVCIKTNNQWWLKRQNSYQTLRETGRQLSSMITWFKIFYYRKINNTIGLRLLLWRLYLQFT